MSTSRFFRHSPLARYTWANIWLRLLEHRSAHCFSTATRSVMGEGANTQPSLMPGDIIFDSVSRYMTLDGSRAASGLTCSPSKRSRP